MFTNDLENLNINFYNEINNVNKLHNRATLKISKKYFNEFQTFLHSLLKEYENELKDNIDIMSTQFQGESSKEYKKLKAIIGDINKKIESEIEILKQKYQKIIKIKNFEIDFDKSDLNLTNIANAIYATLTFDLTLENAKKNIKKQSKWSNRQEFFSGFYDTSLDFKDANENIIDQNSHKIEIIIFGSLHDKQKDSAYIRKIDGIKYKISGIEGNKMLKLTGDKQNPLENVIISPDIINLGIPFEIGKGIKSLTLQGNEEIINFSDNSVLKNIDANKSKRYYSDEIALYQRNEDGSKGKIERIFNTWG